VLARLGREVAETSEDFDPDPPLQGGVGLDDLTPIVSPIVCRSPYFAGMSKSIRVAAYPPTWISFTTKSAPANAVRRSRLAVTTAPAPDCALMRFASASA
jgi:hypothetical protein